MSDKLNGKFLMVDGLDGVGKGVVLDAIVEHVVDNGKRVFDLHDFWKENHNHPDFTNNNSKYYHDLDSFDVLVSAEPTFVGIGKALREEIIKKNGRKYSVKYTADAYAMDRMILYQRVLIPALKAGKTVLQSRSVSTSIVYQPLQSTMQGEEPLSVEDILSLEGNNLALQYAPDLFIIPTIKNVEEVMERLEKRSKKDDCDFENLEFQLKLKPHYESEKLRKIFEERGTRVEYLDAGISIDSTKKQAVNIFKKV